MRDLLLLALLALCAPLSFAQDEEAEPADAKWFSGELELGLDAALTSRDGDIEMDQVLRLKMDPPKRDRLHFQMTLWTIEDLDGHEDSTSVLRSISDASDAAVQARLLSLYMEIDEIAGDSSLRIGRQRITDGSVYNRIDGARFKWHKGIWDAYVFGGVRASIYEDASGDFSTGAGAAVRLPTKTRLSFDYFYGEDIRRSFEGDDVQSSLTSFSIRQALTPRHSIYGQASWFDTRLDEVRFMAQGFFDASEVVYTVSYRNQLSSVADRVTDITEFYYILGELNEYQDIQTVIAIPVTKKFAIGVEAQVHDAENTSLESGNRDFQRYGVSFDLYELGKGYETSVYLNYWDSEFGEGQWTVTGEVGREWEKTRGSIGVDYDRFQDRVVDFDPNLQQPFTVESREDIYSLYVRVRHEINDRHDLRFYTSFEEDDGPDSPYWRLRADYTFRF